MGAFDYIYVFLPDSYSETMVRQTRRSAPVEKKSNIGNLLVLEDYPIITNLYQTLLEDYVEPEIGRIGKVFFAEDGDTALRLAGKHKMDVFSVDRRVPGLRGEDFITLMRRMNPLAPIIVASGEPEIVPLGEDFYLKKPFELAEYRKVFKAADAMVAGRRGWNEQQVVTHLSKVQSDSRMVDERLITESGWPPQKVEEYLGAFRAQGLKPMLSFSPAGFAAMVDSDMNCLVNLYDTTFHREESTPSRVGMPYSRLLGAVGYIAAHEKMHVFDRLGFIQKPALGVDSYMDISQWQFALAGRGAGIAEMFTEIAVDRAVADYTGGSVINQGLMVFLEEGLAHLQGSGHMDLPKIAQREVLCKKFAGRPGHDASVTTRLKAASAGYRGQAEAMFSQKQGDNAQDQRFYTKMVGDISIVFDETNLKWGKIQAFDQQHLPKLSIIQP